MAKQRRVLGFHNADVSSLGSFTQVRNGSDWGFRCVPVFESPLSPIQWLAFDDFDRVQHVRTIKQDQVVASPARRRDDQSVTIQERRGCTYIRSSTVVALLKSLQVHTEMCQISSDKS